MVRSINFMYCLPLLALANCNTSEESARTPEPQGQETANASELGSHLSSKEGRSSDRSSWTQEEKLKWGLALYSKYPPPDWGSHRLKNISEDSIVHLTRYSKEEWEFYRNFDLWDLARAHLESKDITSPKLPKGSK